MISNPLTLDPSRLDEAKRAYDEDLRRFRPQLVDDRGQSTAVNPFVTQMNDKGELETSFNRWIDSENRSSAQNAWFDSTDEKGNKIRRPSWQATPEYLYSKSQGQFDSISSSLDRLQGQGLQSMRDLYDKVVGRIS